MGDGVRWDLRVWTTHVVVTAVLAAYVAILYLAAVLAGQALGNGSTGADLALPALAAAVAALTLEPFRGRLRRRLPVLPQDRLTRLARGAVAADDVAEILQSTAQLVHEGLGTAVVEITTVATSTPGVARWPAEAVLDGSEQSHVTMLARGGSSLGHLRVTMPAGAGLSPRDRALLADVAQHLTTILHTAVLRDALRATVTEAELLAGDLRASRQRLVLASQRARRRVERDIHDGAQQYLVALAVHLGLLRSLLADRPAAASGAIEAAGSSARSSLAALEELSHGLYPSRLAEHGLLAALQQSARSSPLLVAVRGQELPRVDADVEAAVYFCCLEAMQNAVKHARASRVDLDLAVREGALTFTVSDDGRGFVESTTGAGAGMQNMRDRLEAVAGSLHVTSTPGCGTSVVGEVPARRRPGDPRMPARRSASRSVTEG